jgi:hypothetical protein
MQLTISFENREVVKLTGASERALRYWGDRRIVVPDIADAVGRPGIRRRYSFPNLVECGLVIELLQYGISPVQLRAILVFLRKSLYFTHWPRQYFLVVQEGVAVGAFIDQTQRGHTARLTASFPRSVKKLSTSAKLGDYLERILRDADQGDSFLVVAVHAITERLAAAVGLPLPLPG